MAVSAVGRSLVGLKDWLPPPGPSSSCLETGDKMSATQRIIPRVYLTQGVGGVPIPGGVQEPQRCDTWGRGQWAW